MFKNIQTTFKEYPGNFWVLMGATFIDRLGGALLFPFFALYVTLKFNVGMTEVGILFAIFAITGQFGSVLGGALTDKFGRKSMIIFGLISSALSSVAMGLVNEIEAFYFIAAVSGLLGHIANPAQQAMVADLLPEDQRSDGYAIWREVANLAVMFGPLIGGFMAESSYLLLFVTDAVTSIITAIIVFVKLPETKPESETEPTEEKLVESLMDTFRGYGRVLKDKPFVIFLAVAIIVNLVYLQMNSSLSVFMRDHMGMPIKQYGYILSMNAGMVVFFQFWVTRKISDKPPMLMMALGAVFLTVGFGMYGFVEGFLLFALAMAILTVGEMIVFPIAQAMVAKFSPEDMRGRYMATFGLSWTVPFAIGPFAAGIIMDNYDPNWVWYVSIILGVISIIGYLWLHQSNKDQLDESLPDLSP